MKFPYLMPLNLAEFGYFIFSLEEAKCADTITPEQELSDLFLTSFQKHG